VNQLAYLSKAVPRTSGPILEVGGKDHGGAADFRSLYPNVPYIAVDLEAGKNVDVVFDLTMTPPEDMLAPASFALIICSAVLEHVDRPWRMAEQLTRLLRPGGSLFVAVPWVHAYHPYPDDYYRFSWRGIMALFPELQWKNTLYSTNVLGEFFEISQAERYVDHALAAHGLGDAGARKYLPYLMVNMIGVRPA
jgi:SAM-dependent methyltransferase